jgi:hypothetical protein
VDKEKGAEKYEKYDEFRLAMSKLRYFPDSSFRFLAFVNKKNETSLFFRFFFGSINIKAVRFFFKSKTAKLKKIVSLC